MAYANRKGAKMSAAYIASISTAIKSGRYTSLIYPLSFMPLVRAGIKLNFLSGSYRPTPVEFYTGTLKPLILDSSGNVTQAPDTDSLKSKIDLARRIGFQEL